MTDERNSSPALIRWCAVRAWSKAGLRLVWLAAFASVVQAAPRTTGQEIESLLAYLGSLEGARFVRNGEAYSAEAAVSHLRKKWRSAGGRITSAEEFILYCATSSSVTGEPYLIRFADGRQQPAAEMLRRQLLRLRQDAVP